jgi:dihydroorotate dehydrogenase electron transfer subunit
MDKFQEDALIIDQQRVAAATYRMRLHSPKIAAHGKAGQFVLARVANTLEPLLRRPFSFHRLRPAEGVIELLYRVVGRGTWLLSQYSAGVRLSLIGPLGNGFTRPEAGARPIALLAGGIGIAPLIALIETLRSGGWESSSLHLFYGARTADELLAAGELGSNGVPVYWTTDDGSFGDRGYATDRLARALDDRAVNPAFLYSCGNLAMQYQAARVCSAYRIPAELSLESLMACGVGACLGCALPSPPADEQDGDRYLHVCKDGPIFSPDSIQWQKIQYQQPQVPIFLFS